jgi:putative MFS transporter
VSKPSSPPPSSSEPRAAALIARLERIPFSRWHLRVRVIVGSATFFDAFDALSLAFVLPVLVREWQLTTAQIGWLIAGGYLGQFVGALLFGTLAERHGRVTSIAGATGLMSIMSLTCLWSTGFWSLLALRVVQGIGVGGEMPVAAVYINELSKARGRGRFFLLYEMIFPVGLMATGQIGALLVPTLGWRVMFLIGGLPGLLIALLLLRLRESPRWLIGQGRLDEAERVILEIEATSGARLDAIEAAAGPTVPDVPPVARPSTWLELLSPFYRGRTLVVWTIWASAYLVTNGLNNWMPTLYNRIYGLSLPQALRAATMTNVAQVVILLACALMVDRVGRRRWTMTSFAIGAALLASLGLFASQSVAAVIALVTLGYGVVGSVNAVLYLYTPEIYPTRMRAIGTGAATCWLRLASAAGPLLVGHMVESRGPGGVFLTFAGAAAIGMLAATRMLETRNRRLEEIAP